MTDHRKLQDNIVSKLSWYTTNIKLNTVLDYYDENKDAEFFFCLPLSLAFDANVQNVNAERRNFPGIDLGDRKKRICFQITSTNTKAKVQHTLNEFLKNNLDNDFDRLIVLIVNTDSLPNLGNLHIDRPFDFDAARDVWNMPRLIRYFDSLPYESYAVLQRLSAYLDQQLPGAAPMIRRLVLPPVSALEKRNFVGRESEKESIREQLEKGDKLIVLSGLGGMGKTELAVRFGRDYKGGAVYFIRFEDSFTRTLAKMANGIRPALSQDALSRPEEELCGMVLDILEGCGENDLLIVDNVDADSGVFNNLLTDDAYDRLYKMNIRLLITTRFKHDRSILSVSTLGTDELRQIFTNHQAPVDQAQADALIAAVKGHTLTIDLIARTLADEWTPVTPEEMLDALAQCTLADADLAEVNTDWHESKEQLHIYQRLRKVFEVANIPETEQDILRFATLLPESGMDVRYFRAALTKEQQKAFPALGKRGWLTAEDKLLTIHPVIRLVCREELKPNEESCGAFLNALWRQLSNREYDRVKFAQMAEVFANAMEIDGSSETKADWLNRSGRLLLDLMESRKAAALYERYIPELEQKIPTHPTLATAYNNVGATYGALGDHSKALEYQLKALAIREEVLPPEHPDLAASYNNVGGTYGALGDHKKALEYKLKALAIWEKVLLPEHPSLATSYNNVGITYGDLGEHSKALEYQLKALAIFEKVLPSEHPDLAASYNNVGYTYGDLGEHSKALEYKLKALEIKEKVLPPEHPSLATAYNNVGITYGDLGDHSKALEYKLKDLAICEKVLPPEHPSLATSYNNVSCTYSELGDTEKDLEYGLKALAIREKVLPPDHPDLADSYHNVGCTYRDLGDDLKALELYEIALAILEKRLPAGHPDTESTKRNIAIIKQRLAEKETAAP